MTETCLSFDLINCSGFILAPVIEEPSKMLKVCYVTNWSRYRPGEAKFEIEFIDPFMCSHIIYAYATVDEKKPEIIPVQQDDIGKNNTSLSCRQFSTISFRFLSDLSLTYSRTLSRAGPIEKSKS